MLSQSRANVNIPSIAKPKKGDICYASTNRQEAEKFMVPQVYLIIVIGSQSSSNSSRLPVVAEKKLDDGLYGPHHYANRSGMVGRENTHRGHQWRLGTGNSGTDGNRSVKGMLREKRANSGGREKACYFSVAKGMEQTSDRREYKSA